MHKDYLEVSAIALGRGRVDRLGFKMKFMDKTYKQIRDSIVVSIPACHAGDPGSIPGHGAYFLIFCHPIYYYLIQQTTSTNTTFIFFKVSGFWGFGEIGRASCRERVC